MLNGRVEDDGHDGDDEQRRSRLVVEENERERARKRRGKRVRRGKILAEARAPMLASLSSLRRL